MLIRQETAADTDAVYDVVKKAFENARHTNHDEQNLVNRRFSGTFAGFLKSINAGSPFVAVFRLPFRFDLYASANCIWMSVNGMLSGFTGGWFWTEEQFFTINMACTCIDSFPVHFGREINMMENDVFEQFENGFFVCKSQKTDLSISEWKRHDEYEGVFIKHLVNADQTGGRFSCHLVRISPNHRIGWHSHPDSMELHEVIRGCGSCLMYQGEIAYVPGVMGLIDRNEFHEVKAGKEGLFLFAKFIAA